MTDSAGNEERFAGVADNASGIDAGAGGGGGDMEWTAFLSDCEYQVEPVVRGCRMMISYAVFSRTFGGGGAVGGGFAPTLISPGDGFTELLSPVLNMSRGRRIGFFIQGDYGVDPSEALADSLVPSVSLYAYEDFTCVNRWLYDLCILVERRRLHPLSDFKILQAQP